MMKLKRFLCVSFAIILSLSISFQAFATETENNGSNINEASIYGAINTGHIPNLPNLTNTIANEAFPASYDPRLSNGTTPVKDQYPFGLCCAFGTMSTLENTVYKKTGIKQSLSEEAMRYTSSNFTTNLLGHEPDMGFYYRAPDGAMAAIVTNSYISRQNSPISYNDSLFWLSPNLMSDVKYTTSSNFSWPSKMDTSYAANYATEIEYINPVKDVIKSKVLENGAVYTTFGASGKYVNLENGAFNNLEYVDYSAHAIAIIGWDDNFSKDDFAENCKPKNNGAWLIKNSWGTGWGENGFGWISYEDVTINICHDTFTINKVAPVSKNEYSLSYDYLPPVQDNELAISSNDMSICMANVYDVSDLADEYGTINKVTFYSKEIGASYKVYVVPMSVNDTTIPSLSQLGSYKAYGSINFEGYVTAKFSSPFTFDKNTNKVAVIVCFTRNYYEDSKISIPSEVFLNDYYKPTIYKGESYYYQNGSWKDLTLIAGKGGNFCIRPTLVRRTSVTKNSTLSTNQVRYQGKDIPLNIYLNGNQLYSIKKNGTTLLYQDTDFYYYGGTMSIRKTFLDSLSKTSPTNIVFEFTDGNSQTLTILPKSKLTSASFNGKIAQGQNLIASVQSETGKVTYYVSYQWQSSSNGTTWSNISGATSNIYKLTNNEFLKYVRLKVSSKDNSVYYYPNTIYSAKSSTKVIIFGDVDLDGVVTVSDATKVQLYISHYTTLNAEQLYAADVDGDGEVTVKDSTYIQQYVADLITKFPVEG